MNLQTILIFFLGIFGVLLTDSIGAILSRRFRFSYVYFTIFTIINYFSTAYFLSFYTTTTVVLVLSGLVGLFDGTVGFALSNKLKAYLPESNKANTVPNLSSAIVSLLIGIFFGAIGNYAAN